MAIGQFYNTASQMAQVAAFRMPSLIMCATGVALVGTLFNRIISKMVAKSEFTKYVSDKIHAGLEYANLVDPIQVAGKGQVKEASNKTLLYRGIVYCAAGALGAEAVKAVFGPAPQIYNQVLRWLGPVRISNETWAPLQLAAKLVPARFTRIS